MLEMKSVDAGYGTFQALFGVSLEVRAGEAVGVIGPNGAGKTTLMRVISGLIRPRTGAISMEGVDVLKTPEHRIVSLGIAHVPENRRLFPRLTVTENLKLGAALLQPRKQLIDPVELLGKTRACGGNEGADPQVFLDRQRREQAAVLRHMRNALLDHLMRRQARDGAALERHDPFARGDQAGDDPHQRGLAGAVRTDDADGLAAGDLQRHAEQRLERSVSSRDGGKRQHIVYTCCAVACDLPR